MEVVTWVDEQARGCQVEPLQVLEAVDGGGAHVPGHGVLGTSPGAGQDQGGGGWVVVVVDGNGVTGSLLLTVAQELQQGQLLGGWRGPGGGAGDRAAPHPQRGSQGGSSSLSGQAQPLGDGPRVTGDHVGVFAPVTYVEVGAADVAQPDSGLLPGLATAVTQGPGPVAGEHLRAQKRDQLRCGRSTEGGATVR